MQILAFGEYIASFATSQLAPYSAEEPWSLTAQSESIVRRLLAGLAPREYQISDEIAIQKSAVVEAGAMLKGPLIIGPTCFIAAGAYLRGGTWLDKGCVVGPGTEIKSSFIFSDTKAAHLNFVGDSILGSDVNLEAGAILANCRNEREQKEIFINIGATRFSTGVQKFGALVGDHARIGANAVTAPGTILLPRAIVPRTAYIDQEA